MVILTDLHQFHNNNIEIYFKQLRWTSSSNFNKLRLRIYTRRRMNRSGKCKQINNIKMPSIWMFTNLKRKKSGKIENGENFFCCECGRAFSQGTNEVKKCGIYLFIFWVGDKICCQWSAAVRHSSKSLIRFQCATVLSIFVHLIKLGNVQVLASGKVDK